LLANEPHREKRGQLFIGQVQFNLILIYRIAIPGAFLSVVSGRKLLILEAVRDLEGGSEAVSG
jgi:hypothetical protein